VFFFDEAHLLFNDASPSLLEKIEQVVRLIRSKGVGVYFVTQNPLDIPVTVLGQLSNRVQHALRAFTPKDQKAVRSAAETFRTNPDLNVEIAITELGVGEALMSFLDDNGTPGIVDRALVCPPESQIGGITDAQRREIIQSSVIYGFYEKIVDRESAYELLKERADRSSELDNIKVRQTAAYEESRRERLERSERMDRQQRPARPTRQRETATEAMAKSAARAIGSTVGRQIIRGILGSIFGTRR
jgi:DNA helicase HerA-like ATPase